MTALNTQGQLVLDSLPDMIRAAVIEIGVDLNSMAPTTSQPTTAFNFVPSGMQQAFARGDHQTIDDYNQRAAKDMDPIFANMRVHEEAAWVQVVNKSNSTPYWISIAGDPKKPDGYMWTYTDPRVPAARTEALGTTPGYIHTVQVGTLSRNTTMLGISNQLWDNKALAVTAAAISTIVTTVLAKYVARRIAGTAFSTALSQAALYAGKALISRGVVTAAGWLAGSVLTAKVVGGALAGAALTLLIMFIADFVYREYKIAINIYNWTDKAYTVSDYWGENETPDDDQTFIVAALPGRATTITLPDGMAAPVAGDAAVAYSTYVFRNVNKVLEGLSVAMRVKPSNGSAGLLLGYFLGRFKKNRLALSGDSSQSLSDFWKSGKHFAPDGSLKWSIKMQDGTSVLCSTTSLSGRSDQFYEFNVQIGLDPAANFEDVLPGVRPRESRPEPMIPKKLSIGDHIGLIDEGRTEVVATF